MHKQSVWTNKCEWLHLEVENLPKKFTLKLLGSNCVVYSRHQTVAQNLNHDMILKFSADTDMHQVSPSCSLFSPEGSQLSLSMMDNLNGAVFYDNLLSRDQKRCPFETFSTLMGSRFHLSITHDFPGKYKTPLSDIWHRCFLICHH